MLPRQDARRRAFLVLASLAGYSAGCSSRPEPIRPPEWDPPAQAAQAIKLLDANGDGVLDAAELKQAPGLAAGAKAIDSNGDGKLSEQELGDRFELFRQKAVTVRMRTFHVTYRGRPLAEAEVTFQPEPFLEGVIEPAKGVTDAGGMVAPNAGVQGVAGMRPGYYRVQVTSPKVQLPAKFNAETKLGAQVTLPSDADDPYGPQELPLVD